MAGPALPWYVRLRARFRLTAQGPDPTRLYEWFSAVNLLVVWCLYLAWRTETFAATATFAALHRYASEPSVAIVAGALSVLQAAGLAFNSVRLRKVSGALSAAFYAFLAWAFWVGNPGGVEWLMKAVIAAFMIIALWRLGP